MPDLLIRIKRHADGAASLSCTRGDGTVTWQRQNGQLGGVFPPHDLTHYALETALGYRRAFYGLIAEGWELSDFAPPWPRGRPPEEAREVELLVVLFDNTRRGAVGDAKELTEEGENILAASRHAGKQGVPRLTDEQIATVRALRAELIARWNAVAPGESMELVFERS